MTVTLAAWVQHVVLWRARRAASMRYMKRHGASWPVNAASRGACEGSSLVTMRHTFLFELRTAALLCAIRNTVVGQA